MEENSKKSIIRTFAIEWFLYLFFLFIITVFILSTILFEKEQVLKREENRLSTQAKIINDNLLMQIYSINQALKNIKLRIDQKENLTSDLKLFANVLPTIRAFIVLDKAGKPIASSRDDLMAYNYSSREYFKLIKSGPVDNKLYISSPYISVLGALNMNLAVATFDKNKEFSGIILAAFEPSSLSNLLSSVIYAKDMKASIIHGDGTLFLTIPDEGKSTGKNLINKSSVLDRHIQSGTISNTYKGLTYLESENKIISFYTLHSENVDINTNLYISVSRNLDILFLDLKNELYLMGILYSLLLISSIPGLYFLQKRRYVSLQLEIKQQEENTKILEDFAYIDSLTKIANRRYFEQFLEKEWKYCQRNQKELTIILIDIDYFKQYNDAYGHQAGDLCLQKIASCLDDKLNRSHDLVARYGGEEFICILPNTNKLDSINIAERLKLAVEELNISHENSKVSNIVTISLGLSSVVPKSDFDPFGLIKKADNALYLAKDRGRNRVEFEEF